MQGGQGAVASCPGAPGSLPAPSFQGHSRPEASPGETAGSQRPRRTQNRGQCPRAPSRGGCHSQLPPGRPSCPSSFLLSAGSANLALEPRIFQKADLRLAQGTGAADCASREGAGRAGPPRPAHIPSAPSSRCCCGQQAAPTRHHPGHLPPRAQGEPRRGHGSEAAVTQRRGQGGQALCMIRFQSFFFRSEGEA